jgi:hypothetical protein
MLAGLDGAGRAAPERAENLVLTRQRTLQRQAKRGFLARYE